MADDTDREATKIRLLAMAAGYEARAGVADELTAPDPDPGEANGDVVEPALGETLTVKPVRKIATRLKETIVLERRPVVRGGLT